jgi:hypothetical protein
LDDILESPVLEEEPSTKKLKKQHQQLDESLDDMLDDDLDALIESDKENQDVLSNVPEEASPSKLGSPRRARSRVVIDDE